MEIISGMPIKRCLRCGHMWIPRTPGRAKVCPWVGCKSIFWDTARRDGKIPAVRERHLARCRVPICLELREGRVEPTARSTDSDDLFLANY